MLWRANEDADFMTNIFCGKRALLAEDEVLIAMVLSDMLTDLGFAYVETVRTAGAAMASASGQLPPDVAILDLHLTDGITIPVAELLGNRGVRSIFVTGDFGASSTHRLPADFVLMKPFSPADLEVVLRNALANPLLSTASLT